MQQYTIISALVQLLEEEGIPNTILFPTATSIGIIKTTHTWPYLIAMAFDGNLNIMRDNPTHKFIMADTWTTIARKISLADPLCHKIIATIIVRDTKKINNTL